MAFITFTYLVFALGIKPSSLKPKLPLLNGKKNSGLAGELPDEDNMPVDGEEDEIIDDVENEEREETGIKEKPFEKEKIEFVVRDTTKKPDLPVEGLELPPLIRKGSIIHDFDNVEPVVETKAAANAEAAVSGISITKPDAGESLEPHEVDRIMENYDPRLDLSHYKFPPVSILKEHKSESAFDNKEVFENKENIIKTLGDHKIAIKSISATIGPTVTLYEIVPERGVRLARIKSLEDDIALNLSALGIRIIAPIPGRGTVGIEVPNKKPEMVSMRSLITSKAFQETKFDIALALGRTITNDPYIVDLTKMPHLLVAGATGQGKSVGINAIITSILIQETSCRSQICPYRSQKG